METDPNALEHEYNGHVVWEIVEESEELPPFQIAPVGLPPPVGINGFNVPPGQVAKAPDPNRSVAVALGHLMVASNIDLLKTVLDARNPKHLVPKGNRSGSALRAREFRHRVLAVCVPPLRGSQTGDRGNGAGLQNRRPSHDRRHCGAR